MSDLNGVKKMYFSTVPLEKFPDFTVLVHCPLTNHYIFESLKCPALTKSGTYSEEIGIENL